MPVNSTNCMAIGAHQFALSDLGQYALSIVLAYEVSDVPLLGDPREVVPMHGVGIEYLAAI
jgi:hypothetical protein